MNKKYLTFEWRFFYRQIKYGRKYNEQKKKRGEILIREAPEKFKLEDTTIWSFPERGSWVTHSGKYRGNWSPYIPRNLILRYSRK